MTREKRKAPAEPTFRFVNSETGEEVDIPAAMWIVRHGKWLVRPGMPLTEILRLLPWGFILDAIKDDHHDDPLASKNITFLTTWVLSLESDTPGTVELESIDELVNMSARLRAACHMEFGRRIGASRFFVTGKDSLRATDSRISIEVNPAVPSLSEIDLTADTSGDVDIVERIARAGIASGWGDPNVFKGDRYGYPRPGDPDGPS